VSQIVLQRGARALALAVGLILYGNAKAWWDLSVLHTTAAGSTFGVGAGIALVLAILVGGMLVRTDFGALGLSGGTWQSSLRLGVWIGGTAALAACVLILFGALVARFFGVELREVTPSASVAWGPLLWRAVLLLWVDTVIPEELGFRGALLLTLDGASAEDRAPIWRSYRDAWVQVGRAAVRPAVVLSSVAFAAWHVVVVLQEGGGFTDIGTVAGKLLLIAVGGLLFGGLRVLGGNLLAPIVGHWLFDMLAMIAARLAFGLV
jgi:membrane protease YdiL (CAAX protease family)